MYLKDALAKYGENFRNMGESKEDFLVRVDSEWDRIVKLKAKNQKVFKLWNLYPWRSHNCVH